MKIYNLPQDPQGLIFDIDLTLYDSPVYAHAQIDLLIKRAALELHRDYVETRAAIEAWQNTYAETHQQARPSLGNTFVAFGIPIEQSIRWREELLKPEDYLCTDSRLQVVLEELKANFKLVAVTNNPSKVGKRTLDALGVADCFLNVIGLDNSGVSKPHKKPFNLAQQVLALPFYNLVSIGDRYEIDIAVPLDLGMGGILVENMQDVYSLPAILQVSKD